MQKATTIQRRYRLYQLKAKTGRKLKDLRQEQATVWGLMQQEFVKSWSQIKQNRRIEIHINSFSIEET